MQNQAFCRNCREFSRRGDGGIMCPHCKSPELEPVTFIPVDTEVSRLIKQSTRISELKSIDVLRDALKIYLTIARVAVRLLKERKK